MPRAKVTQLGLECQTHKQSFLSDEPEGDDIHHFKPRCNLEAAGGFFFLGKKEKPWKKKELAREFKSFLANWQKSGNSRPWHVYFFLSHKQSLNKLLLEKVLGG
jgi:hypothetical protein